MPATIIAPEEEPQVETRPAPIRTTPAPVDAPKPAGRKQPVRDLLVAIFQGHEEFLGWTPE